MAKLPRGYNTDDNNQSMDDFTAMDAGTYAAMVTKSEYKETKAKTGHYLQLVFMILEGKYKGRFFFENLNLDNPNPVAVDIANKMLNSICKACNKASVEDSEELHEIPVNVTIKINPKTATHPASNSSTKYEAYEGSVEAPPSAPVEAVAPAGVLPDKKKLPWE